MGFGEKDWQFKLILGMFGLTLFFPVIGSMLELDSVIIVFTFSFLLFATMFMCIPGTGRLILSIAKHLEDNPSSLTTTEEGNV